MAGFGTMSKQFKNLVGCVLTLCLCMGSPMNVQASYKPAEEKVLNTQDSNFADDFYERMTQLKKTKNDDEIKSVYEQVLSQFAFDQTKEGKKQWVYYTNQYLAFLRTHGDYDQADALWSKALPIIVELADDVEGLSDLQAALLDDWKFGEQKFDHQYFVNSVQENLPIYERLFKKHVNLKNQEELLQQYDGLIYFLFSGYFSHWHDYNQDFKDDSDQWRFVSQQLTHVLNFRASLGLGQKTLFGSIGYQPGSDVFDWIGSSPKTLQIYYQHRLDLFEQYGVKNQDYKDTQSELFDLNNPNDWPKKLTDIKQKITQAQKHKNIGELIGLWMNKGDVFVHQNNDDQASKSFQKADAYWQSNYQIGLKQKKHQQMELGNKDYDLRRLGIYLKKHNPNRYEQIFAQIERDWSDSPRKLYYYRLTQSEIELSAGNERNALNLALSAQELLSHIKPLDDYERTYMSQDVNELLVQIYDKLNDTDNVVRIYEKMTDVSSVVESIGLTNYDVPLRFFVLWANKHPKYKPQAMTVVQKRLSKNFDDVGDGLLINGLVYPLRTLLGTENNLASYVEVHKFINEALSSYQF